MDNARTTTTLRENAELTHTLRLSSLLYTATLDSTYSNAAELSIQFTKNFLSNGTMVFDTYDISKCASNMWTFTYNAGYFLRGLSLYYTNVTSASEGDLD